MAVNYLLFWKRSGCLRTWTDICLQLDAYLSSLPRQFCVSLLAGQPETKCLRKATETIQDFESWIKKITGDIKGKHQVHFSIEAQLRFLNLLARTWRPTPSLMVNISVNIPNYTIRSGDSSLQDQAASEGNWAVFPANSTSISEGHARRCTFSRSLPIHYPLAHMYYSARYAFPARLWGQIYWLRHFDSIYLLKATV